MKTLHINVQGVVQGVYYRKNTLETANSLHINGTVKNLEDGSVEIFAQGEEDNLAALLYWTHTGSPKASVTNVESRFIDAEKYDTFEIIRS